MNQVKLYPRSLFCERGTSMIEFAIVVPLLVFLLVATVEFGRYTSQYQLLSQITVDALNLTARIHDLEPNITCQTDGNPNPPDFTPLGCATAPHHLAGHDRANVIASLQSAWVDLSEQHVLMESRYNPATQAVRFRVSSEFTPLFPAFFNHIPFTIELTGPYLPGTGIGTGVGIPKQTLDDLAAGNFNFIDGSAPNAIELPTCFGCSQDHM